MREMLFVLLLMLPFCQPKVLHAGRIEPVLAPPSGTAVAGEEVLFTLYFHNTSESLVRLQLKEQITCLLHTDAGSIELSAHEDGHASSSFRNVAVNGFVKKRYTFLLPEETSGIVTLQIPEYEHVSTMFAVQPRTAVTETETAEQKDKMEKEPEYQTLEQLFTLYQPYIGNIAAYEPMYFLAATALEKSKFQLSAKYRIFDQEGSLAQRYPWLSGLYLAYTQTAFWDLKSASKPFGDTSYKPEFFFLSSNLVGEGSSWSRLFLQTGFQHESNGRGGTASRRTNFLYLKPIVVLFKNESLMGLQIAPKIWTYVANEDENNPDIADYRGYFDLEIKAGKADALVVESHLRYARQGPSVQLDFSYPLHRYLGGNLDVYLHLQYVSALAENLLNYWQRTEAVRLGISIVR